MTCHTGTTIIYNDTIIRDCLTERISQDVIYSDGDVDPIGLKVTVEVVGYVHQAGSPGDVDFGHYGAGGSPTAGMGTALRRLGVPRRPFNMVVGTDTLFDIYPSAVENCAQGQGYDKGDNWTQDIDNGPKPSVQVVQIVGQAAYKVRFSVTFMVQSCGTNNDFNGLLSLRFWIADDIDATDWLVRRTYHGRLRIKSHKFHPHAVARTFAIPPLQPGFQRQRITLAEDPNGLEVQFTIVDQERWAQAPAPATDWSGEYVVNVLRQFVGCEAECRVRLKGAKTTPKTELLILATKILDAKLHLRMGLKDPGDRKGKQIVLGMQYREDLRDNQVEASARIKFVGTAAESRLVAVQDPGTAFEFGKPLDNKFLKLSPAYHKELAYQPGVHPTSVSGLLLAALQSPCCPAWFAPTSPSNIYDPPDETKTLDPKVGSPSDEQPQLAHKIVQLDKDTADAATDSHKEYAYLKYEMTSRLHGASGTIALGLAKLTPVAGRMVSQAFVRLGPGTQYREITIDAERIDAWPEFPQPGSSFIDDNGIQHVLEDYDYDYNAVTPGADYRTNLHSAYCRLLYSLSRPVDPTKDSMEVGALPFRKNVDPAETAKVDPSTMLDPDQLLTALGYQP